MKRKKNFCMILIVDNSQALEMANIYTNILSSTLDAFASIIANNQNEVLKRLVGDHDRTHFPGTGCQYLWHECAHSLCQIALCFLHSGIHCHWSYR